VSTGSGDTTKVWAHLPPITVGSTFGGVVGINEHKQTAEATAEIFVGEPYAVFAGATNCDGIGNVEQTVDIGDSGKQVRINGSVHSNGAVEISQKAIVINGEVTYVTTTGQLPPGINPRQTGLQADPLADVTIDDYVFRPGVANKASVAQAAGLYWDAGPNGVDDQWFTNHRTVFDANGKLNNVLIYTTGPIELNTPLQG